MDWRSRFKKNGITADGALRYNDGRSWGPLDVTDGRPRLMITEETVLDAEGKPTAIWHTDWFNVTNDGAIRLYLAAGPLLALHLRERKETP